MSATYFVEYGGGKATVKGYGSDTWGQLDLGKKSAFRTAGLYDTNSGTIGGGKINGSFLKAGLIDEISVLIYPGIDGLAGVPSIFEYVGKPDEKPAEGQSLRHLATETLDGGTVWLRYAVEKS